VGKAKNAIALIAQAEKMFMAENQDYCGIIAAAGNAAVTAVCTSGAVTTKGLNDYVELTSLAQDKDWSYGVAIDDGPTFTITATKLLGDAKYSGKTITMTNDGACVGVAGTTHPLAGTDCGM
jgi:hypothetical protein